MSEINIDKEQLNTLKEVFNDGFGDFIKTYLNDIDNKEKELQLALNNKDLTAVAKIAHAIKGSSANVGVNSLADLCDQLEKAAKTTNLEQSIEKNNQLQQLVPLVKSQLNQFLT